jgi:GNAT superfamily N-acetyltransferase
MNEFIKKTWGGYDYIGRVWDKWLTEEESEFILAMIDDEIIGCVRLNMLSEGEIWLEGLRVREEYQGKGLAWDLQDEILKRADKYYPRVIRYATGSRNKASIHIGKEVGFKQVFRYTPLYFEGSGFTGEDIEVDKSVNPEEIENILKEAYGTENTIGKFLFKGWVFYEINLSNIQKYFPEIEVYYTKDNKRLKNVISLCWDDKYNEVSINLLYSGSNELPLILKNSYDKVPYEWREKGIFFCCGNKEYIPNLLESGFKKRFKSSFVVLMEKRYD